MSRSLHHYRCIRTISNTAVPENPSVDHANRLTTSRSVREYQQELHPKAEDARCPLSLRIHTHLILPRGQLLLESLRMPFQQRVLQHLCYGERFLAMPWTRVHQCTHMQGPRRQQQQPSSRLRVRHARSSSDSGLSFPHRIMAWLDREKVE